MILLLGTLLLGLGAPPLLQRFAPGGRARASTQALLVHAGAASLVVVAAIELARLWGDSTIERSGLFALVAFLGLASALVASFRGADRHAHTFSSAPAADDGGIEGEMPRQGAESGEGDEGLEPEGMLLLARLQNLDKLAVDAVMLPRERIAHVEGQATVGAALERLRESGLGRVLVVEGGLDRVLGVAHAKDLVPLALEGGAGQPVRSHLRRWLRVASGQMIAGLLEDFRQHRLHLGLVTDIRGRTLGLVTLQDVLHHIATPDGDGEAGS